MAFAEQLGRVAGTVQAKTEGWMDGATLKKEVARVRDGAAELLQQLTADAPAVPEEQIDCRGSAPKKSRTQCRHRRRAREQSTSAHAHRSWRVPSGQSGGENARGENDGQDIAAPRARLRVPVFVTLEPPC